MEVQILTGEFTDWIREQIKARVTKRYKLSFIADDMNVTYMQLWRFMKGEKVNQDFINKAMRFLLS
jgi:hypothetical protein